LKHILTASPSIQSWQHFARLQEINSTTSLISWFANNNADPLASRKKVTTGVSMLLHLPPDHSTPPTLVTNLTDPKNLQEIWSQGSFLHLDNGNYFMGYGDTPVMTEYAPLAAGSTNADVLWTARFSNELVDSYRTYKQVWHATPATKPALAVQASASSFDTLSSCAQGAAYRGYVSWNGATDVTSWEIFTGATNASLKSVGRAYKMGFETEFVVPKGSKFVQIGAIENNGDTIVRKSEIVAVGA
jgi:hypothetical protein